jgi:hypothetical protein
VYFIMRRTQAERSVVFLRPLERSFRADISGRKRPQGDIQQDFHWATDESAECQQQHRQARLRAARANAGRHQDCIAAALTMM